MSLLCFDGVSLPGALRERLSEIRFELGQAECAFLLGPNGAGKSSVVRSALGLEHPTRGSVRLGGTELARLTARQRAARVAWLPQQMTFQEALSAREVVSAARYRFHESRRVAEQKASDWLARVGAEMLAERRVTQMSGGEQQRVKLAALLAQEAPLLLLDEPANHLDPAQQLEVYRMIGQEWQRGMSVLCVTHDINLVSAVGAPDRIRLLGVREGKLCFDTNYADPELATKLEDLYDLPFEELRRAAGEGSQDLRWYLPRAAHGQAPRGSA